MDDLTREFLIESQEGLDRMERCLTELEERPQDKELLAEIFRSVHTIKGTTGFLGYKRLEKLAHAGESLLGLLRDGKMTAGATVITALLHLLDGLREILKAIEAEGNDSAGDDTALIARLEKLQAPAQNAKAKSAAATQRPREAAAVKTAIRAAEAKPAPPPKPSAASRCLRREAGVRRGTGPRPSRSSRSRGGPAAGASGSHCRGRGAHARRSHQSARPGSHRGEHVARGRNAAEPHDEPGGRAGAYPQPGAAGHGRRSQHDPALAPPRHGHGRPSRVGDEGAHAAGLQCLLQDAAPGPRSDARAGPPRAFADGGPGDGARQEPARSHQGSAHPRGPQRARSRH